jgi:dipeptidyl-peptidase-4
VSAQQLKPLTIDDIFLHNKFAEKTVSNIQWLPDGSAFTFTRDSAATGLPDIYRHEIESGKEVLVLDGSSLSYLGRPVRMSAYKTTRRQNHLLITGKKKQIWRHSYSAPYYLYDMTDRSILALVNQDTGLLNLAISPDRLSAAYAKNNNLFVFDVKSETSRQLTFDGNADILNGVFDWVYEEEFEQADAFQWSPDSKKIAFWRTDQTRVKTFTMIDELPHYSKTTGLKYPKVGEQNAIVSIGVAEVATGRITWMDVGADDDIYIPRVHWTHAPNTLAIQRLNRRQNELELLLADVNTGICRTVLRDSDSAWVDVTNDYHFLSHKDQLVLTSQKSGYRHIYLHDYNGSQIAQLTAGDWEVTSIIALDENAGWVYFYGKKTSVLEQHVYRVSLDGRRFEKVSSDPGWYEIDLAPDCKQYVEFYSNAKTPTQVKLRRSDGRLLRVLEKNEMAALNEYQRSDPQFLTIPTSDGVLLNAYMIYPPDFDPDRRYPVIVYGYGGPGSQMVVDRWGLGNANRVPRALWHQMMATRGYLIFCVDNRGTGGRGKAFENLVYGDLSRWAVHDQIAGARYLAALPYVDSARIGFWGWSGGGYLTCLLLTRAPDDFSVGVSVAAVTDFRNYDTIWAERYMRLLSENKAGYDAASVLQSAAGLRGKLLLVHGTGDDNVHPQNTLQLVDLLIENDKQFDLMLYPNRNHGISGGNTQHHLYTLIADYFGEHL